jgi:hypothetical protein
MAVVISVFLCMPFEAWGQRERVCAFSSANPLTPAELDKILQEHKIWLSSNGSQGSRAKLIGAGLGDMDLHGANLSRAELHDVWLDGADLHGADLDNADLHCAHLDNADLSGAELGGANLNYASLYNAALTGADFFGAYLQNAIYEPKSYPAITAIATANKLELLTYELSPIALVQLRKQFQENGFRVQEREVTYALNRRRAERDVRLERWFNTVAFDFTCQYGMNPGRALRLWLALLFLCWFAYAVFIHLPGQSGIYRIERHGGHADADQTEEQIRPRPILAKPWWLYPPRVVYRELRILFWAGFFSLMSAFNIGFRDINFGRWLRLLPRTEYDLRAKGWVRTVAGFQSLISVYLIALWVLTYFGRPFE